MAYSEYLRQQALQVGRGRDPYISPQEFAGLPRTGPSPWQEEPWYGTGYAGIPQQQQWYAYQEEPTRYLPEAAKARLRTAVRIPGKEAEVPGEIVPQIFPERAELPTPPTGQEWLIRKGSVHAWLSGSLAATTPYDPATGEFIFGVPPEKALTRAQLAVREAAIPMGRPLETSSVSMMGYPPEVGGIYQVGVMFGGPLPAGGALYRPGFERFGQELFAVGSMGLKAYPAPGAVPAGMEILFGMPKEPIGWARGILSELSPEGLQALGLPLRGGKLDWTAETHHQVMSTAWGLIERRMEIRQYTPVFHESLLGGLPEGLRAQREVAPGRWEVPAQYPTYVGPMMLQPQLEYVGRRPTVNPEELGYFMQTTPEFGERLFHESAGWRARYREPIQAMLGTLRGTPVEQAPWAQMAATARELQPEGRIGRRTIIEAAAKLGVGPLETSLIGQKVTFPSPRAMIGLAAEHKFIPLEEEMEKRTQSRMVALYGGWLRGKAGLGGARSEELAERAGMGLVTEMGRFAESGRVRRMAWSAAPRRAVEAPAWGETALAPAEAAFGNVALARLFGFDPKAPGGAERLAVLKERLREEPAVARIWGRPAPDVEAMMSYRARVLSEEMAQERGAQLREMGPGFAVSQYRLATGISDVDRDRFIAVLESSERWTPPTRWGPGTPYAGREEPGAYELWGGEKLLEEQGDVPQRFLEMMRIHAPERIQRLEQQLGREATPQDILRGGARGPGGVQEPLTEWEEMASWAQGLGPQTMEQVKEWFMQEHRVTPGRLQEEARGALVAGQAMGLAHTAFLRALPPHMAGREEALRAVTTGALQPALDIRPLSEQLKTGLEAFSALGAKSGFMAKGLHLQPGEELQFEEMGKGQWQIGRLAQTFAQVPEWPSHARAALLAPTMEQAPEIQRLIEQERWPEVAGLATEESPIIAMIREQEMARGLPQQGWKQTARGAQFFEMGPEEKRMGRLGQAARRATEFIGRRKISVGRLWETLRQPFAATPGMAQLYALGREEWGLPGVPEVGAELGAAAAGITPKQAERVAQYTEADERAQEILAEARGIAGPQGAQQYLEAGLQGATQYQEALAQANQMRLREQMEPTAAGAAAGAPTHPTAAEFWGGRGRVPGAPTRPLAGGMPPQRPTVPPAGGAPPMGGGGMGPLWGEIWRQGGFLNVTPTGTGGVTAFARTGPARIGEEEAAQLGYAARGLTEWGQTIDKLISSGENLNQEQQKMLGVAARWGKTYQDITEQAERIQRQGEGQVPAAVQQLMAVPGAGVRAEALVGAGPMLDYLRQAQAFGGEGGGGLRGAGQGILRYMTSGWGLIYMARLQRMFMQPVQQWMGAYTQEQLAVQQAAYQMGGQPGITGVPAQALQAQVQAQQARAALGAGAWEVWGRLAGALAQPEAARRWGPLAAIGLPSAGAGLAAGALATAAGAAFWPVALGAAGVTAAAGTGLYAAGRLREEDWAPGLIRPGQPRTFWHPGLELQPTAREPQGEFQAWLEQLDLPYMTTQQRAQLVTTLGTLGITREQQPFIEWAGQQAQMGINVPGLLGQAIQGFGVTPGAPGAQGIAEWLQGLTQQQRRALPFQLQRAGPLLGQLQQRAPIPWEQQAPLLELPQPAQFRFGQVLQGQPQALSWWARQQGQEGLADLLSPTRYQQRGWYFEDVAREQQRGYRDWQLAQQATQLQAQRAYTTQQVWPIEAQLRGIGYAERMAGFEQQGAQAEMGYGQFLENWQLRREQFQLRVPYQREQMEAQRQMQLLGRGYQGWQLQQQGVQLGAQRGYLADVWGIQDQQAALQYAQQQAAFNYQAQQRALQGRQFQEQWGLSMRGFQLQTGYQRQQTGEAWQMQMVQRGWTREDWETQASQSAMQFGWRQEDLRRQLRYSRGPERAAAQRQIRREQILENERRQQFDKQKDRQSQIWDFEDRRHTQEVKYFNETNQLQLERLEQSKEHFEQRAKLEEGYAGRVRAAYEEQFKLNEQLQEKQREWQTQQLDWQGEALAKQQEYQGGVAAIQDERYKKDQEYFEAAAMLQEEALSLEREQYEARKILSDEYQQKVKGFYEESFGLQEELEEARREWQGQQFEWQEQAIEKAGDYNERLDETQETWREIQRQHDEYITGWQERMFTDGDSIQHLTESFLDWWKSSLDTGEQPPVYLPPIVKDGEEEEDGLQRGGIVTRPMRTWIGEAGPEIVLPLRSNLQLPGMDETNKLLRQLVAMTAQLGNQLGVNVYLDSDQIAARLAPKLGNDLWGQTYEQ